MSPPDRPFEFFEGAGERFALVTGSQAPDLGPDLGSLGTTPRNQEGPFPQVEEAPDGSVAPRAVVMSRRLSRRYARPPPEGLLTAAEWVRRARLRAAVQALDHLSQAFDFGGEGGDVVLELGVPLAQIDVLPRQAFWRGMRHGLMLHPKSENALGRRTALTTRSADAMMSGDILFSERAPPRGRSTASVAAHARWRLHDMGTDALNTRRDRSDVQTRPRAGAAIDLGPGCGTLTSED